MRAILIGRNKDELASLERSITELLADPLRDRIGACELVTRCILVPESLDDPRRCFNELSGMFRDFLRSDHVTVIAYGVRPLCLNPLLDLGWDSIVAMLILAFPEIRWFFGVIRGYAGAGEIERKQLESFRTIHGVANLFEVQLDPTFDGTGLRDWIRHCAAANQLTSGDAEYLARRKEGVIACSVDDETPYTYLQAYAAYRFGFRAITVNSARSADYLFGPKSRFPVPLLTFEDIYVNFPDGSSGMSWLGVNPLNNRGRNTRWPRLSQASHRIFVTSGHRSRGERDKWTSNRDYLAQQRDDSCLLYKPYAGIFRLWQESGLRKKLRWYEGSTGRLHRGVADGFNWPPSSRSIRGDEQSHSSPGVFLAVAESLIGRAEELLPNVRSVMEAIHGAVFATDALELLGGRTPTVAIQALQLKHHFEVVAECKFAGVEHHIQLEERFTEIERDVTLICGWFGRAQQTTAAANAELRILVDLLRVFREAALFDEEQACMRRARTLHRQVSLQRRRLFAAIAFPFRWYLDFLLGSIPRFLGAIGVWLLVLTCLYSASSSLSIANAFHTAFVSFLAIEPPAPPDPNVAVSMLAMVLGATHLGIFISHLYSLMARK